VIEVLLVVHGEIPKVKLEAASRKSEGGKGWKKPSECPLRKFDPPKGEENSS
jgi:hypothetical protein